MRLFVAITLVLGTSLVGNVSFGEDNKVDLREADEVEAPKKCPTPQEATLHVPDASGTYIDVYKIPANAVPAPVKKGTAGDLRDFERDAILEASKLMYATKENHLGRYLVADVKEMAENQEEDVAGVPAWGFCGFGRRWGWGGGFCRPWGFGLGGFGGYGYGGFGGFGLGGFGGCGLGGFGGGYGLGGFGGGFY